MAGSRDAERQSHSMAPTDPRFTWSGSHPSFQGMLQRLGAVEPIDPSTRFQAPPVTAESQTEVFTPTRIEQGTEELRRRRRNSDASPYQPGQRLKGV